jgi:hypothetical protein
MVLAPNEVLKRHYENAAETKLFPPKALQKRQTWVPLFKPYSRMERNQHASCSFASSPKLRRPFPGAEMSWHRCQETAVQCLKKCG